MSLLDDITLLCEGVASGPDVRLLELARAAVRDRDFLRASLLEDARRRALALDDDAQPPAYPLRWHCVESYLLEPDFLEAMLHDGGQTTDIKVRPLLEQLAGKRRWLDTCRAAIEAVAFDMRNLRPCRDREPTSKDEAIEAAQVSLSQYQVDVTTRLQEFDLVALVEAIATDFDADGPIWARVDGKALIHRVEDELRALPGLRGGNLRARLLTYAERHGPPGALVSDIEELLRGIAAASLIVHD